MYARMFWLALVTATTVAQTAPRKPITLSEALALLEQRNLSYAAGRFHVEATRAQEVTARLRPNPVFSSLNEDFNVFDPQHFNANTDWTQNLSYLIERGGKRQRRIESAQLGTKVAAYQFDDSLRQLRFQAKVAFTSVLLSKGSLGLAQENLADYARTIELSKVQYQAGDISKTDLDRVLLQNAKFESDLLAAQTTYSQAAMSLQVLIGEPNISDSFDIDGTLDPVPISSDRSALISAAMAKRPDYLAAAAAIAKADADHRLAQANGATDVNIGGEIKRSGPDNNLGVTLTLPLRVIDRNQGEKARTELEYRASQSVERAVRLQVSADVAQAWAAYENALKLSELYQSDYAERARQVRDRVQFSYRNGATSLLDYIQALRDYRDTELAALNAKAQVWNAIHQLSFVTATELVP